MIPCISWDSDPVGAYWFEARLLSVLYESKWLIAVALGLWKIIHNPWCFWIAQNFVYPLTEHNVQVRHKKDWDSTIINLQKGQKNWKDFARKSLGARHTNCSVHGKRCWLALRSVSGTSFFISFFLFCSLWTQLLYLDSISCWYTFGDGSLLCIY